MVWLVGAVASPVEGFGSLTAEVVKLPVAAAWPIETSLAVSLPVPEGPVGA